MPDKYTATWVSHSSISSFLACPRGYFLRNVYKDPKTNRKIKLMAPALALGQAVHEVLEGLSNLPTEKRFLSPIMDRFDAAWERVHGKHGGFFDMQTELKYQNRGRAMIRRVQEHPGPLARLAVKMQQDLPYFWLSEEDNIILCGKIDWLEYLPETDSVHIIDFKTGKMHENDDSLQLPIYLLLVQHCQNRKAEKASYWYLETEDDLTPKELPNAEDAHKQVLDIARQIHVARQLKKFSCPSQGCRECEPYERILGGEAEYIGLDDFGADVYILERASVPAEKESIIL